MHGPVPSPADLEGRITMIINFRSSVSDSERIKHFEDTGEKISHLADAQLDASLLSPKARALLAKDETFRKFFFGGFPATSNLVVTLDDDIELSAEKISLAIINGPFWVDVED